jgi:PPOX class probable FMN-dependent enzyme
MANARFNDVVTSEEQFRAVMGNPMPPVVKKEISYLDANCRRFIAKCPFVLISSCDGEGRMDISPKGDPAGFVQVLDDSTLAIPDRPGNRRADTFKNILQNDRVGLFFLIPGKQETLRASGRGIIVRDLSLREQMAISSKIPDFAIVVTVDQVFFHCPKCVIRSHLWSPETWPDKTGLPSLAEAVVAAGKLDISVEQVQEMIEHDAKTRLY